jgi:hypothetical protein
MEKRPAEVEGAKGLLRIGRGDEILIAAGDGPMEPAYDLLRVTEAGIQSLHN